MLFNIKVFAQNEIFNFEFLRGDSNGALAGMRASEEWSFFADSAANSEAHIKIESWADYLSVGHSNNKNKVGFSKLTSGVGLKYTYEIKSKSHQNRYIDEENLTNGEYWSSKTTIGNGSYRLEFSIENGGIYAYNQNNNWEQIYFGECYTDTGDFAVYRVEVEGEEASIYRNNEFLTEYILPKDSSADSYEFSTKSKQYADNAITLIEYISLTDKSDEIVYEYEGISVNGEKVEDIIGAVSEGVDIELGFPVSDAAVNAVLEEDGEQILSDCVIENGKIRIIPKDGFEYGKSYSLYISISGINVSGIPEKIEFKTSEDDFIAESTIDFKEKTKVSAAVIVSNYSGKDTEVTAAIFAYSDNMLKAWSYIEWGMLKNGQSTGQFWAPEIDCTEADKVVVMVFDNMKNIRPIAKVNAAEVK